MRKGGDAFPSWKKFLSGVLCGILIFSGSAAAEENEPDRQTMVTQAAYSRLPDGSFREPNYMYADDFGDPYATFYMYSAKKLLSGHSYKWISSVLIPL